MPLPRSPGGDGRPGPFCSAAASQEDHLTDPAPAGRRVSARRKLLPTLCRGRGVSPLLAVEPRAVGSRAGRGAPGGAPNGPRAPPPPRCPPDGGPGPRWVLGQTGTQSRQRPLEGFPRPVPACPPNPLPPAKELGRAPARGVTHLIWKPAGFASRARPHPPTLAGPWQPSGWWPSGRPRPEALTNASLHSCAGGASLTHSS